MTKHKKRKSRRSGNSGKLKTAGLFFQTVLGFFILFIFVLLFDILSRETLIWGIVITGIILVIGVTFQFLKRKTIKDSIFKKLGV